MLFINERNQRVLRLKYSASSTIGQDKYVPWFIVRLIHTAYLIRLRTFKNYSSFSEHSI